MMKKLVLKYGYFLGIISQLILILVLMSLLTDVNEIFRYAARFSGRFSFSLYLLSLIEFFKILHKKSIYCTYKKSAWYFFINSFDSLLFFGNFYLFKFNSYNSFID